MISGRKTAAISGTGENSHFYYELQNTSYTDFGSLTAVLLYQKFLISGNNIEISDLYS